MAHTTKNASVVASLAAATLLLTPTAAFAQAKSSTKSVDSLSSVIKEVKRIREQVHGAIDSLGVLTSSDEYQLPKYFKAYSKHVERMTKAQKTIRRRVEDMQARREAYLQEWDVEMRPTWRPGGARSLSAVPQQSARYSEDAIA